MSTRETAWPAGTPCWVDYSATDVTAASDFYAEVFGWRPQSAGPEYGGYVMCRLGEHDAAGIGPSTVPGAPPAWLTYLSTADADATCASAAGAGGTVLAEPFDVMTLGRMAVVVDSQGAVFGLWQAGEHIGCGIYNEPGALVWNEAAHADPAAGRDFYGRLFGYSYEDTPDAGDGYVTFASGGDPLGGMGPLSGEGVPPHWLAYFMVADADATIATVTRSGGAVTTEPFDTEYGRMAVLTDPWGATFAIMGAQG